MRKYNWREKKGEKVEGKMRYGGRGWGRGEGGKVGGRGRQGKRKG